VLTLLALALRVYYVNTTVVVSPLRGDAGQYSLYAWNLAHHGTFAKDIPGATSVTPDNYRDPGYPLFLAGCLKILGDGTAWYSAILLSQALLGALTVTLVTQLGRYWLSPRWAAAAGLLMAVWPHNITIGGYLLSETLFGFLCAVGMLLCAVACRKKSYWQAAFAGIILGCASLTNAMLSPFALLLGGFLAWRRLAPRGICVVLAISSLLLPGVWAIRNTQIANGIAGSSSKDRALQNLVEGSWPDFQSAWRDSIFGSDAMKAAARIKLHTVDMEYLSLRTSPWAGARAMMQRLGQQPWQYAAWYLFEKPYSLWSWDIQIGQGDIYPFPVVNAPFQKQPAWMALGAICHGLNPLLIFLALASVLFTLSKPDPNDGHDRTMLVVAISLMSFVTLIYSILQAEPRYSIPFRPYEMLLAMTALSGFASQWRKRRMAANPLKIAAIPSQ